MSEQPNVEENGRLGVAVQKFVHQPEFNALERLVCSYLIRAIASPPLETITYTMRAAMTLDDEKRKELAIDPDEVASLYTVAGLLQSAIVTNDQGVPYSAILEVNTLDYQRDVAPWRKNRAYRYMFGTFERKKVDELTESGSDEELFEYSCRHLTVQGYRQMVADFLRYAMPKTQEITGKLTGIVSPATYGEILRIFQSPAVGDGR